MSGGMDRDRFSGPSYDLNHNKTKEEIAEQKRLLAKEAYWTEVQATLPFNDWSHGHEMWEEYVRLCRHSPLTKPDYHFFAVIRCIKRGQSLFIQRAR